MSRILSGLIAFLVGVLIIGGGAILISLGVNLLFPGDEGTRIVLAFILGLPLGMVAFPAIIETYEWAREWTP